MEPIIEIAAALLLSVSLSVLSYRFGLLTGSGASASFFVGAVVGVFGSLSWLIILLAFTVAGFLVTRIGLPGKKERGVQEGERGERDHRNILGVGIPPCIVALASFFVGDGYDLLMNVAFISSVAVAAADTVASEIGVRDPRVWLITSFERVAPGTDGGVSVFGTSASLVASLATAALGWFLIFGTVLDPLILVPATMGMVGNLLDSVLGATLERRGMISKYGNNCATEIIGALAGGAIVALCL
ncbi:MAG: DUF92 domain-containing protein [Candidatus Methanomethylophilaceae archaeon]|nr:DUF92 domain-containing protein [Candidatus Methanomethylophilaceae archaeon]NLF33625.1 DUF92 domain-containing protein [Thermoplasmatales archaeon]